MQARLLIEQRYTLGEGRFADIVVWRLPASSPERRHGYKYRLAFVVDGVCVLRFDNEAGKGDHKHIGTKETPYDFTSLAQLQTDFWAAIEKWRPR